MALTSFINKINISAKVTEHIVGEHHTIIHQRIAGGVIMAFGVTFVKVSSLFFHSFLLVEILVDIIGYAIHGIGLIPFAANLEKH